MITRQGMEIVAKVKFQIQWRLTYEKPFYKKLRENSG